MPKPLFVYVPVPKDNVRNKEAYKVAHILRANCIARPAGDGRHWVTRLADREVDFSVR